MSSVELAPPCEISYFELPDSVEQARQLVPAAQLRLAQREQQVNKPFRIAQLVFCGFFLIKWLLEGHYIGGLIFALLLWCATFALGTPLQWFSRHERLELKRLQDNIGVVIHKARTDFMAQQQLGPYRWIYRGDCMLGLFPEAAVMYLYAPQTNYQHALIDTQRVVRQARVEERTQTSHTSHTQTTHGARQVYGGTGFNQATIGKGQSSSTTRTTSTTHHTFSLQIQLQVGAQTPYWTSWSFGNDWEEAENWRLQIAQAAGLERR